MQHSPDTPGRSSISSAYPERILSTMNLRRTLDDIQGGPSAWQALITIREPHEGLSTVQVPRKPISTTCIPRTDYQHCPRTCEGPIPLHGDPRTALITVHIPMEGPQKHRWGAHRGPIAAPEDPGGVCSSNKASSEGLKYLLDACGGLCHHPGTMEGPSAQLKQQRMSHSRPGTNGAPQHHKDTHKEPTAVP